MKIAVIFHRLGPYHFARLRSAGKSSNVVAIETSGADNTYAWDVITGTDGFERVTLFENADAHKQPTHKIARRMIVALEKIRPQVVVVPGWADSAALAALQWCGRHQIPTIIMSESTAWDETRCAWREAVKGRIVRLGSAALVGGTPHKDYLKQLGMPAERVFLGYDAVDNRHFADKVAEVRSQKSEVEKKYELPENYFLASARFIEKKNLTHLIEAYARYRQLAQKTEAGNQNSEMWHLVLLGDGPLRPDLCRLISGLRLQDSIHLPGFKQYPDLPAYYGCAQAFIHASTTEQWGLVVNEAMASCLPVLVSTRCGCAQDLVLDGVNGFTFDPCDVEQLTQLMLRISDFRFPISEFGTASARIIANWGPERFAQGLTAAVEKAVAFGPVKPTLLQRIILKALLTR